jgi:hypothetical protein
MDINAFLSPNLQKRIEDATDVLVAFFRNDRKLRREQAQNEAESDGFQQGVNNGTTDTIAFPVGSVALANPYTVFQDGQDVTNKQYSYLVVEIEDTSGSGRHNAGDTSVTPTAAGIGHKIPAGGTEIVIPGTMNIRNFKMIAETGQTLNYTMQGFL